MDQDLAKRVSIKDITFGKPSNFFQQITEEALSDPEYIRQMDACSLKAAQDWSYLYGRFVGDYHQVQAA